MKKYARHENFFMYHLYDEVQNKYGLSETDMNKLVAFIQKFHGEGAGKALSQLRKRKNRKSLDQIVQEVAGRELQSDSVTEMKMDPIVPNDSFSVPSDLPLSINMLIDIN